MQPNQMIKQCLKINDQIVKEKRNIGIMRRLLQNIRASTNHSSSLLGYQEEFKLQQEEAKLKIFKEESLSVCKGYFLLNYLSGIVRKAVKLLSQNVFEN